MQLDTRCVTCEHGEFRKIPDEMGRMLFCALAKEHCKIERTGTAFYKCGESAKHYRKRA